MNPAPHSDRPDPSGAFVTTHWTRVLAARGKTPEAKQALSELCAAYYAPVLTFLRCSGKNEERAKELAHQFFAKLLQGGGLAHVQGRRGRFRSYLLGAVKHFVADQRAREMAVKRGGGREHLALAAGGDTGPGIDPPDQRRPTPEKEFDRQWALTILERAFEQLEKENQSDEGKRQFQALKPWLTGDTDFSSQAEAAARLMMTEGAVKVAIHRLRKRFREALKAEIARTVTDPEQVAEEMRSLIAALRSSPTS